MRSQIFNTDFSLELFVLLVVFFAFGAIIGSFLNVVIHRLPLDESIAFPASHCPRCDSPIRFYDNIPILSWLFLKGRCRACRAAISARYPFVEAVTATIFAVFFLHHGLNFLLPFDCLFAAALVALVFIDREHMILPNAITYPGFVCALLVRALLPLFAPRAWFDDLRFAPLVALDAPLWSKSLLGAFVGALVGGGFLWLVGFLWKRLRGVDAMGLGDVKMMLMVGAYLGWRLTVLNIFLAALTGAVAGIVYLKIKNTNDYQTQIPFGIFLGIGALLAMLFGGEMIRWYLTTFVAI